jgi:hypothetical protein
MFGRSERNRVPADVGPSAAQSPAGTAVTMGCGDECPLVRAKSRVDWQIPVPKQMSPDQFNEVRNLIEKKVKKLRAGL